MIENKVCDICGKKYRTYDNSGEILDVTIGIKTGELVPFCNGFISQNDYINFCPTCFKNKLLKFLKRIKAKINVKV